MDRLNELRGEAGGSGDSTLDTTSPPSEAFMSANENSSKYFSINDSTFDVSPIKDVSLASTSAAANRDTADNDELISNLSPIGKKELLESYKIGKQIEAANILSGGVDIFDDNSFDGDELVIDDNAQVEDNVSHQPEVLPGQEIPEPEPAIEEIAEPELAIEEPELAIEEPELANEEPELANEEPELAIEEPELANEEPELAIEEPELVIEEPELAIEEPELAIEEPDLAAVEPVVNEPALDPEANAANREMEVVLQIDGNNLNAIDIGNGLYLYRKDGQDELAAIQIMDDDPQHGYKFLKVRDNAEGNLEVYEEIEIEVPKEVPTREGKSVNKNAPHVPTIDVNKQISDTTSKLESKNKSPQKEPVPSTSRGDRNAEVASTSSAETKTETNLNGKMMKFNESRKSPVVGSYTPMTFHSTPNKEGKPLTKTMVDLQLDPNRHSENVKKTIEVHTDSVKQKSTEPLLKEKEKDFAGNDKSSESVPIKKDLDEINKATHNEVENKNQIKEEKEHNEPAVIISNELPKLFINTDKTDTIVVGAKDKNNDGTEDCSSKQSSNIEIKPDTIDGVETVLPDNKQQSEINIAVYEPEIADSLLPTTSKVETKEANPTNISEETILKTENPIKSAEEVKPAVLVEKPIVDMDEANINNLEESNQPSTSSDKCQIVKIEPKKYDKPKVNKTSLAAGSVVSDSDEVKLTEQKLGSDSIAIPKLDDSIDNYPLESFTDVSSACAKLGNEDSKGESITLYSIDTDESVSLITPSRVSKTSSDKAVIDDNISQVLTSISNFNDIHTANTSVCLDKSKNLSPATKSNIFTENEIDISSSKSAQESSTKLKNIENLQSSDSSTSKSVQENSCNLENPESKKEKETIIQEKTVSSAPLSTITTKQSKSLGQLTSIPNEKPSEVLKLNITTDFKAPSSFMAKTKIMGHTAPETKPLGKLAQDILVTPSKQPDKPGISAERLNSNVSDKQAQPAIKVEPKTEKHTVFSVAPNAKVPEKKTENVAITTSAPAAVKHPEISSTANIRPLKPDSHIPVVSIASKPATKHIQALKFEGVAKSINIVSQKEFVKNNTEAIKLTITKVEARDSKEPIRKPTFDSKPVNNNHSAAVPFGKWTDAHRQQFLNKFKEVKVPVNCNTKQIKNSNDLNRRDVLQKIDSQRAQTISNATAKSQDKGIMKTESVFSSKVVSPVLDTKTLPKNEAIDKKPNQAPNTSVVKPEVPVKSGLASNASTSSVKSVNLEVLSKPKLPVKSQTTVSKAEIPRNEKNVPVKIEVGKRNQNSVAKTEIVPRKQNASCFMASLIERTIEDMINRESKHPDEVKVATGACEPGPNAQKPVVPQEKPKPVKNKSVSLDDIEMKMNELHGIPFVERPPHELPKTPKSESKTYSKVQPNASIPIALKPVKDGISDDEAVEHEPITGDMELNKSVPIKLKSSPNKMSLSAENKGATPDKDNKGAEIITENDFDKFARRNSITYENCLTVNFDRTEQHNVVQTVKEKESDAKSNLKQECVRNESKPSVPHKQLLRHDIQTIKNQTTKQTTVPCDSNDKKYQSKIHTAYQSAMTAKHQVSRPISIIEDKPVKVVFLDSNTGFVPSQLNVQGKELSPAKRSAVEADTTAIDNDSLDSLGLMIEDNEVSNKQPEVVDENKHDKTKVKHQRKQVLTPVQEPDPELIQPSDIGIENTSRKKRKLEDVKTKTLVPKKSYLLDRNSTTEDQIANSQTMTKEVVKPAIPERKNTASAIDNLVKAAELLETQEGSLNKSINQSTNLGTPNTPVKRGRGRPRKYPLPEGADNKTPSPQKRPRLIDAKPAKRSSISEGPDDNSSGEENMVRENWTMGKINENIVCPICNKLFRSENVVFKHVKHCTGVSPSRSDSETKSPRRSRTSQESEDSDMDYEAPASEQKKDSPKNRRSKESTTTDATFDKSKLDINKEDVIVIEDTPVKEKIERREKEDESKNVSNTKGQHRSKSLVCEFCGKMFRQQSYLASHKLQHKNESAKKNETEIQDSNKPEVFGCEICKKQFRKLHHLVQHRLNHNPDTAPKRALRKSSSEPNDTKHVREEAAAKQVEDGSAGFRCEPCDKSFRKLHHLVEHRGTHDGLHRHKVAPAVAPASAPVATSAPAPPERLPPPPTCDICNKTFRKLHHLIEHKETHAETNSDKSDEKSAKSALSTKDIIHECSLCYMVFPNEHSLNKHSAICAKKKRQSKALKDPTADDPAKDQDTSEEKKCEKPEDVPKIIAMEIIDDDDNGPEEQDNSIVKNLPEKENKNEETKQSVLEVSQKVVEEITEPIPSKKEAVETTQTVEEVISKDFEKKDVQNTSSSKGVAQSDAKKDKELAVTEKDNKIDLKEVKAQDVPRKKILVKEKSTTPKRPKSVDTPTPVAEPVKPSVESSDDDEVRYMINPNFKLDEISEVKTFMKVRAKKRNSLQIERPNSNDVAKRRTSLQHNPKIPKLKSKNMESKAKAIEPKPKVVELKPKIVESKPKIVESKHKTVESKHKTVESKHKTVESKHKTVESKPKTVESKSKSFESKAVETAESKPKPVESKPKAVEIKSKVLEPSDKSMELNSKVDNKNTSLPATKPKPKLSEADAVLSTDSDDSDVKYSFPEPALEEKPVPERTPKAVEKKVARKSLAEKRKSLGGIAKRKSLGKTIAVKHKEILAPAKPIKKRWAVVEHRCDCGQLFSSAALLVRHTSLAHTPPRIRRRRDPDPEPETILQPVKKASVKAEPAPAKLARKSSVKSSPAKPVPPKPASKKSSAKKPSPEPERPARTTRRSAAHSGVPVPEKMRKLVASALKRKGRDPSWDLD